MNGANHAASGPSSSQQGHTNGGLSMEEISHELDTTSHAYHAGFARGDFADCRLDVRVPDKWYGLVWIVSKTEKQIYNFHKLFLARSPTLLHFIRQHESYDVVLQIDDRHINQDAVVTAVGYLYSVQALQRLNINNAKSILAAATFLGLDGLAEHAAVLCRQAVAAASNPQEIADWFRFLDTPAAQLPNQASTSKQPMTEPLYGPVATQLRNQLLAHITQTLPTQSHAFSTSILPTSTGTLSSTLLAPGPSSSNGSIADVHGQDALVRIYAALPFEIFKSVIESASFPPGDMERFSFAKKCIAERKKVQPNTAAAETAVLAFGGTANGGSSVSVISKSRKSRALWKVGESA